MERLPFFLKDGEGCGGGRRARTMGISLGELYISGLLMLNAVAILHEQRFLAKSEPLTPSGLALAASARCGARCEIWESRKTDDGVKWRNR